MKSLVVVLASLVIPHCIPTASASHFGGPQASLSSLASHRQAPTPSLFTGESAEGTGSIQADSLLRSLFDMRMARQRHQEHLSAPMAHLTAPTSHSLGKEAGLHPLRVTGSQAMLAKQAGLGEGMPALLSKRRATRESGELGARNRDYQFVNDLRVEFEEDQAQRYA